MISIGSIKSSFSEFEIDVQDTDAYKLLDLCSLYEFNVENIVDEWLAFQSQNNSCLMNELTLEGFSKFLKSSHFKEDEKMITESSKNFFSPLKQKSTNVEMFETYLSPVMISKTKQATGFESPNLKTPSKSPFSTKYSQDYSTRHESGKVLQILIENQENSSSISWNNTTTKKYMAELFQEYKKETYMFQKIVHLSDSFNDNIEISSEDILEENKEIESFFPCRQPSQNPVTIIGRIAAEGCHKLSPTTVVLVGDIANSSGRSVAVDISKLTDVSLFKGQIAAFTGINPTGTNFIAEKMLYLKAPEGNMKVSNSVEMIENESRISIMVASGPFTTSDSLSYEPLLDFITLVKENKPDVTLLLGPLLDENHQIIKNDQLQGNINDLSEEWISYISSELQDFTQVVFLPSQKDIFHHPVYPQPSYKTKTKSLFSLFTPDPCLLKIGGVIIGATSTDVLMHIGANEISCPSTIKKPDRRLRLMSQLVDNRNFYPVYPAHDNLPVDWLNAELQCKMTSLPDILIVSSDLSCFVKTLNGRVFLNPGKLSKGSSGGTYAHLLLNVGDSEKSQIGCISKIVKI